MAVKQSAMSVNLPVPSQTTPSNSMSDFDLTKWSLLFIAASALLCLEAAIHSWHWVSVMAMK